MFYLKNHDRADATNAKYAHGVICLNVSSENLTRNQRNDARTQIFFFNNRPFLIHVISLNIVASTYISLVFIAFVRSLLPYLGIDTFKVYFSWFSNFLSVCLIILSILNLRL